MPTFVTGDTHGKVVSRLKTIPTSRGDNVIILGDVGLNYYLTARDMANKEEVEGYLAENDIRLYCVRGNHEERPERLKIPVLYDHDIYGKVRREDEYPHILYLEDGGEYKIDGYKTLVIGGAYSVDKHYRIERAKELYGRLATYPEISGWFPGEQLTSYEMEHIMRKCGGKKFDFVLTHTCPYDWMPRDLFLSCIDQETVEDGMERWLNEVKDRIVWDKWLFGHFHRNRFVRPNVEMLYGGFATLDNILLREQDGFDKEAIGDMEFDPRYMDNKR